MALNDCTLANLRRLGRADLPADTAELARYLIGKVLVHESPDGTAAGRIVETEAYPVGDSSSHAYRGETARNAAMFLERGHAYVYLIYGRLYCLNVASEGPGVGAAVLLRALEPLAGLDLMAARRGTDRVLTLARGPGRLTAALGIDLRHDGLDLCSEGKLWLGAGDHPTSGIGCSARIGLTRERERLLRYFEVGSPYVSGPKWLNSCP